ncbi:head closure Hc1 [Gordonia phage Gsput1]|uniref:Head-to-tail stopper n=1 Tax=Gordonia phage Gsput1 TaxID=1622193 RepID=A0A0E3T673_9CAUD|nr:head closure Hc1 [Gordonia phage Gsput1]AKC03036.1 hypothetical protein Gsput1_11 [Gordonia phage Gsput1]
MPLAYTTRMQIVKPKVTKDRYGGEVHDFADDVVTVVDVERRVAILPTGSTEDATGRTLLVTGYHLVTPPGMDIPLTAIDRVRFMGKLAEVVGEVSRWPHPMKPDGVHHVEAELKVITG